MSGWQLLRTLAVTLCAIGGALTATSVAASWLGRSPMTRGLPADPVAADAALSARILARFPLGSEAAPMVEALEGERFIWVFDPRDAGRYHLRRDESDWLCRREAHLWWTTTSAGDIGSLRAAYRTSARC